MKPISWNEAAHAVAHEIADMVIAKHEEYGSEPMTEGGLEYCARRIHEKGHRLLNIMKARPLEAKDFEDIPGHGIVALMMIYGTFWLPLKDEDTRPVPSWIDGLPRSDAHKISP